MVVCRSRQNRGLQAVSKVGSAACCFSSLGLVNKTGKPYRRLVPERAQPARRRTRNGSGLCCDSAQTPSEPRNRPEAPRTRRRDNPRSPSRRFSRASSRKQRHRKRRGRKQRERKILNPVFVGACTAPEISSPCACRERFRPRRFAEVTGRHRKRGPDDAAFGCRCERRQSPRAPAWRRRPLPLNSRTLFAMTGARLQPRMGRAGVD